jgi:hypothetical protein
MEAVGDLDADRFRQPGGLVEARFDIAPDVAAKLRQDNDGAGAAAQVAVGRTIEDTQSIGSSSSTKLTGCSG